ncbi:MAG: carbohydrate ABC transporter permease [Velocimicrobium sp.]
MKDKRNKVGDYIVLTIVGIIFLLPLCWVILASFDTNATVAAKLPSVTLENYKSVITSVSILKSFGNGLVLSFGVSIMVIVISGLAAYPLSRFKMKHKRKFMLSMLFMTSLPITTIMVPVYKMFIVLKLYDNMLGIILFMTASSMPYAIWMMKNFMDSVPNSLEEAAWCDGASRIKGILRIIAPLMMPGILTIGIYTFSGCWGNFFVPFILLSSSEKYPASITLYQYFSQHTVSYGLLAAYSVMYAMPSVVLYVITQKWMSKGFSMSGADKG